MLTHFFSRPFALARHRGTALGGYLDGFTEWLVDQDYTDANVRISVQRHGAGPLAAAHEGIEDVR
jgi:hypothetical protein